MDGGFSCPNRENGLNGCLFCSDEGSGEFGGSRRDSIEEQIFNQMDFLSHKNTSNKYIAYFQNFTNTYDTVENLRKKYYLALEHDKIIEIGRASCRERV